MSDVGSESVGMLTAAVNVQRVPVEKTGAVVVIMVVMDTKIAFRCLCLYV